jgi:hypothetical protein
MFQDFQNEGQANPEGRKRMGVSLAVSAIVFTGIASVLAAAVATASVVARRADQDVSFATLPPIDEPEVDLAPPPPPPPRARHAMTKRAVANRAHVGTPTDIPDEQPEEAEGELAEAGEVGPVDGFTDGGDGDARGPAPAPVVDGKRPRPAPHQQRESVRRPRFLAGCVAPEIPETLRAQAATIRIDVRMMIDQRGRVTSATVLTGHALIPEKLVLSCARAQEFEPAELPDGTAVPYPFQRRFVFRPASA